jgi:hypothetical protein
MSGGSEQDTEMGSWAEYVEGIRRVRVARQEAMAPGDFADFMRPFLDRLALLTGQSVTAASFPLPQDAVPDADPHQVQLTDLYGVFQRAASEAYEQEVLAEIDALPDEESAPGWREWWRERRLRLRMLLWPTAADVAADLCDALYFYNAERAPAPAIALAELDALDQALSLVGSDLFVPLQALVAAIAAANLPRMTDEYAADLDVAYERARAVTRCGKAGKASPAGQPQEAAVCERAALAEWNFDPDQDPLWTLSIICLLAAIPALILGVGAALLVTRDINSPWVSVASAPGFALVTLCALSALALFLKVKRLARLGLYTPDEEEEETSEPPRPLGRRGWTALWVMLTVPVLLAIAFDGYPWFVGGGMLLAVMLVITDLSEMRVNVAWVRSHLGWIAPLLALPFVVGSVLVLISPYPSNSTRVGFPHWGFHWPTLAAVLLLSPAEYLLRHGMRKGGSGQADADSAPLAGEAGNGES